MKSFFKRYKLYIMIGIATLILLVGTTFAYYIWKSSTNAIVNLNICTPTITFAGGSTINGIDILPVLSKEDGTIKEIEVSKKGTCTKDVTMNLYLELTTFPTELADSSFKYELYKNNSTTPVVSGNFSNKEEGDTITLLSNVVLASDKDTYTLYIYIDGNMDNPIEMAGKNFLFKVWGSGEGAIYKENVITTPDNPSSSTSKFFNTEVMREEINTLTIAENNKVPEEAGVISKDISSNQDGTVMLWYKPKTVTNSDGTTKTVYDMWIGGENGVLQTNTNASGMFAYLTNVEKLDLSKLDTSYITNMSNMFYNSSGLKEIDLSNFNTSNVTSMGNMFSGCSNLTSLDLSGFDTSKVTGMYGMFNGCSSLTTLDLSNFDTSKVTGMQIMFNGCSNLTSLDLSNFNTSNVKNMETMFNVCKRLTSLDLSSFDTSKVTNMIGMFNFCSSLISLDLSNFNLSSLVSANMMFRGCTNLEEIIFGNTINTEKLTKMSGMFQGCQNLKYLDLSNFNTSNVTDMSNIFSNCFMITALDLSNFDTSKVTNMDSMFNNCSNLISLDLSNFNTSNVTTMSSMLFNCSSLTSLDLSKFNTSNVTNMYGMFYGCNSLTSLELSNFDTSKVTNMHYMFAASFNLEKIYVSNLWTISNVTDSTDMFLSCRSLSGAVSYDGTKNDATMANYTNGYLTYKANS